MGHMHGHAARDYSQTPVNIYWEMTQACGLACRHCRAEAMPLPHPEEMSRAESLAFIDQIPDFGQPLPQLILTGGDPLQREDLFEMIDYAVAKGIGVSITPAATELLTREMIAKLQAHGVDGLGLSLDAATAEAHDGIRGVPGTFARTMQALAWAQEIGMPVQVNTLAAQETAEHIPAVYELIRPFGVKRWSLFFLISVGRGKVLQPLEAAPAEELMRWVYRTSKTAAPMILSTTEAPSYRRVAIEEMRAEGMTGEEIRRSPNARGFGIRDGHGIVFVSNTGDICPAGKTTSPRCTVTGRYSPSCTSRSSSQGAAACASITPSAAVRAPGLTRRQGIRWRRTRSVRMSRSARCTTEAAGQTFGTT
jgi:AdoMet-dependent heme synthase